MACDKCSSDKIYLNYIDSALVMHCICESCDYEWVE